MTADPCSFTDRYGEGRRCSQPSAGVGRYGDAFCAAHLALVLAPRPDRERAPERHPGAAAVEVADDPRLSEGDRALVADIKAREAAELAEEQRRAQHRERQAKAEARNLEKVEALKAARRPAAHEPGTLRGSSPLHFSNDDADSLASSFSRSLGY